MKRSFFFAFQEFARNCTDRRQRRNSHATQLHGRAREKEQRRKDTPPESDRSLGEFSGSMVFFINLQDTNRTAETLSQLGIHHISFCLVAFPLSQLDREIDKIDIHPHYRSLDTTDSFRVCMSHCK